MKNSIIAVTITVFTLIGIAIPAYSHENDHVHPALTERANNFLQSTFQKGEYSEIKNYISISNNCGGIEEGSIKEDNIFDGNYHNCGVPYVSMRDHFYNPVTGKGFLKGLCQNAPTTAKDIWKKAVEDYKACNKEDAYFKLGRVAHILEDMTSPAHVHDNSHIRTSSFESWGKSNYAAYANGTQVLQPSGLDLANSDSTLTNFFNDLADKAYDASAFQGVLYRSVNNPINSHCELAQMFPNNEITEVI